MTILERRASTVYNRPDFNVLEVMDLSNQSPKIYSPQDFFGFYNIVLNIDDTRPNFWQSSQYSLLYTLSVYLQRNQDNQLDSGGGTRKLRLHRFSSDIVSGLGTAIAMAVPGYRVCPL